MPIRRSRQANPKLNEEPFKRRTQVKIPAQLRPGSKVAAGDVLGEIGRMKKDSMLHFEMYVKGARTTFRWRSTPTALPDPGWR